SSIISTVVLPTTEIIEPFDLDGTLCFDGMTMSKELQEVLLTAPKYGHEIIFATARSYRDCLSILEGELKKLTVVLA
ncbi:MAG: HAD hydrolase family protein, partial [Streptococcus salivarius]